MFTLDGTAYNDALNNTPASANGVMTGVETIKEFRVVTNAMSAEYGRAGGGVFNVVTKSGSNQFTGSAFEFFRDDQSRRERITSTTRSRTSAATSSADRSADPSDEEQDVLLRRAMKVCASTRASRSWRPCSMTTRAAASCRARRPSRFLPPSCRICRVYPVANGPLIRMRERRADGARGISQRAQPEIEPGLRDGSARPDVHREQLHLRPVSLRQLDAGRTGQLSRSGRTWSRTPSTC